MRLWIPLLFVCLVWSGGMEGSSFSSGSKSRSSGSRSFSSGSSSKSFSSGSSGSSSKSFSSGSKSSSSSSSSASSPVKSFDSKAANVAKTNESKMVFQKRATYVRPPVSAPEVQEVKRQNFYRNYYADPRIREVHHYHYRDSYNPLFMLWLMDRSLDERAMWMYNHRDSVDSNRYKEMVAKDAALEKRMAELEGTGVKKDPNYQPPGVDNDLIYKSDKELKADDGIGFWPFLLIFGGVVGFGIVVWSVFFRREY